MRLGYLVGAAATGSREIDKVRPPYNVSVLNAAATLFALEHRDEFARQAARSLRASARAWRRRSPRMPRRARAFPSAANMILVRVPDAAAAFEA